MEPVWRTLNKNVLWEAPQSEKYVQKKQIANVLFSCEKINKPVSPPVWSIGYLQVGKHRLEILIFEIVWDFFVHPIKITFEKNTLQIAFESKKSQAWNISIWPRCSPQATKVVYVNVKSSLQGHHRFLIRIS